MAININFNPNFKWLLDRKHRFNILVGSAGSGKSYSVSLAILIFILQYNVNAVVFRKVHRSHKLTTKAKFETVINEQNLNHLFKITRDNITCLINNCRIDFLGLDNPDKIKSLDGYAISFVEEATELSKADFKEIVRRIRGRFSIPCLHVYATNPNDTDSFIKKGFIDKCKVDPNIFVHHSTFEDNPHLDEAQKENLRNEEDEWHRKVYSMGIWAHLNDNQIFDINKLHIANISQNENNYDYIFNGFDAGFTHAAALMRVGIKKSKPDNIYILDEVYLKNKTHKEFVDSLEDYGLDLFIKDQDIYCDSEDPAMIKEFQNNGYHRAIGIKKFSNITQYMIDFIRRYNIIVHPSCVNFQREFKSYHWRKVKDTLVREPVKLHDDSLTAVFYALLNFAQEINGFMISDKKKREINEQIKYINSKEDETIYLPK